MLIPTRRLTAAGVALLVAAGMTGCTVDRSGDAERIRATVPTMPGVDSADVDYVNDFENGANLDIRLDMSDATVDQIRATVDRIDDLERSRFKGHRLSTKITVADSAQVEYGGYGPALNATQISTDVSAVRDIRAHATAASIQWQHFNDYSSLDLWDSTNPDGDLRAAITALPSSSTHLNVRSIAPERQSSWDVALPLTQEQMDDAVGIRGRLPVVVFQVDMRDGLIGEVSVGLGDTASAVSRLSAAVLAMTPSRTHPVTVEWRLATAAPGEVSRFTACAPMRADSPAAPREPSFDALTEWVARSSVGCGS